MRLSASRRGLAACARFPLDFGVRFIARAASRSYSSAILQMIVLTTGSTIPDATIVPLKPNLRDAGEIERAITAFGRASNGGLVVTASLLALAYRDTARHACSPAQAAPEQLAKAFLTQMDARVACSNDRVEDGIALYNDILRALGPMLSQR